MSELALTLLRLGFLAVLWLAVLVIVGVLRRDLLAPRELRPAAPARRSRAARAAAGAGAAPPTAVNPAVRPGAPAPGPAPAPRRAPKPPRPARGSGSSLVVTEGTLAGTVIPLGSAAVTVGRAPDSTLVLDDDYASSRHARLFLNDGRWVVEDLGSTNGTWIDRTRVAAPTVLPVGVTLRVGRTSLQLRR